MLERIKQYWQRNNLPLIASELCAIVMLVCLPLVFRNALFDINRVKADLMIAAAPVCFMLSAASFAAVRRCPALARDVKRICLFVIFFAAAAVASSARCGFSQEVLFGLRGRRSGLLFLLSCAAGFLVIVSGGICGQRICLLTSLAAALTALLGVLNAVGIDPLGFYVRMQKGQEHLFLSTIGNIDFFGCYLALIFPIAAGGWIFDGTGKVRWLHFACSVSIAAGIAVSRSDTALLAVQVGMLPLLVFASASYASMCRTLCIWGISFAALPVMYAALQSADYFLPVTGLFAVLGDSPAAWVIGIFLFVSAACCKLALINGKRAPGVRRAAVTAFVFVFVLVLLLLSAIICFTVVYPDMEIGSYSAFLRFDDHWGTRRGFVYRCSIKALADFSLSDWLVGRGVDMGLSILEPHFDNPAMLSHGLFNDAHCQPLQYLLTTGLLGAGSLIAFYASLIAAVLRYAQKDPTLSGYGAALFAYIPVALLSVSQPILIASCFAVCAAAASRIQDITVREGKP